MPELPELELYSKNLRKLFKGKTLNHVRVFDVFRVNAVEAEFNRECSGALLSDVKRDGKEIFFILDNGAEISVHLMLMGEISLYNDESEFKKLKKKCFAFVFDNKYLLISDRDDKCKIKLKPEYNKSPDALNELTFDYFSKKIKARKKMRIKEFLTNQKIMKGIGNAYSDEILYLAKISPKSWCSYIPEEEAEILYRTIKTFLRESIEQIEAENPDAVSGKFRDFFKVHVPDKQMTETGFVIKTEMIDKRQTYYTTEQVFYGPEKPF
jgi:formamidopyrimidine-DNA glycosylase